jgi:hypothetical protein
MHGAGLTYLNCHRPLVVGLRVALAGLALLTACGRLGLEPLATATPVSIWHIPAELDGTHWKLVELKGQPPLAGTEITLDFMDGKASGNAGCNYYRGPYADVAPDEVLFTITVQGCLEPPGIMEQDQVYTDALFKAGTRALVNGRLEFRNAAGVLTLVFEPATPA